jgi:hypothetical protein
MLSSNRTISIWNALRGKALPEVMAKLCPDKFYIITNSIRKIYKAGNPNYKWMKKLLHLETKEWTHGRMTVLSQVQTLGWTLLGLGCVMLVDLRELWKQVMYIVR